MYCILHTEHELVNLLRRTGIDSQPGWPVWQLYLTFRLGCAHFASKFFLLISEIGSVSHVFRLFTIKFHFYFFAYFCFKFFASLHFSNFCFEAKQSLFTIKFHFYFFTLNFASLRFSNFRFEVKRGGKLFRFKRSKTVHFLFSIFVSHKMKPKFSLHLRQNF